VPPARKPCVRGVAQTFVSVFLLPEPIFSQLLSSGKDGRPGGKCLPPRFSAAPLGKPLTVTYPANLRQIPGGGFGDEFRLAAGSVD